MVYRAIWENGRKFWTKIKVDFSILKVVFWNLDLLWKPAPLSWKLGGINMSVTVRQFKEWLNHADDDLIVTIGGSEDFFLEHIIGNKVNIQFNHEEIIDSLDELEYIRSTLDNIENNLNYFLGRD